MIKKYSEEKRQEVFTARQAGATIAQIAIQTGIGCTTVKTWLKEAGFRSKHRWHPDEIKKIIKILRFFQKKISMRTSKNKRTRLDAIL